jgi:hypothetical protein
VTQLDLKFSRKNYAFFGCPSQWFKQRCADLSGVDQSGCGWNFDSSVPCDIPQEVYVWACNNSSATVDLTLAVLRWCNSDWHKSDRLAARQGDVAILAGNRLTALSVRAVASVANVVVVSANINQTG